MHVTELLQTLTPREREIVISPMKYAFAIAASMLCATAASAQAPGWQPTGEWQCGPHVRIVASGDGFGGIDFFISGAWFDNHYTLRANGQLFFNGVPCVVLGDPFRALRTRRPSKSADVCLDYGPKGECQRD
jgi:hypothetical protein